MREERNERKKNGKTKQTTLGVCGENKASTHISFPRPVGVYTRGAHRHQTGKKTGLLFSSHKPEKKWGAGTVLPAPPPCAHVPRKAHTWDDETGAKRNSQHSTEKPAARRADHTRRSLRHLARPRNTETWKTRRLLDGGRGNRTRSSAETQHAPKPSQHVIRGG